MELIQKDKHMIKLFQTKKDWYAASRKLVVDQDYIKMRYLNRKVLAFNYAIKFYGQDRSLLELDIAYKLYKRYMNKADWYYKRINNRSLMSFFD